MIQFIKHVNVPQGVESGHTFYAGKPESNKRGNIIFVKCLETTQMFGIPVLYKLMWSWRCQVDKSTNYIIRATARRGVA